MNLKTTVTDSALGQVRLAVESGAVTGLWFRGQQHEPPLSSAGTIVDLATDPAMSAAIDWLQRHLQGDATPAPALLAPRGTSFQKQVWAALQQIPRGETITYAALAARIGKPEATRAVAAAVGRNPISVLIPCHRVIGSNGKLTGYAGGLGRKAALLAIEKGHALPWRRVNAAHQAKSLAVLEVDVGDWVDWKDHDGDGEFIGWNWAVAANGKAGWAPRSYFGAGLLRAQAKRSYSAAQLTLAVADEVVILDTCCGRSWVRNRAGQSGWVSMTLLD